MSLKKISIVSILLAAYLLIAVLLIDTFSTVKNFDGYLIIISFTALFIGLLVFNMKYAFLLLILIRPFTDFFQDLVITLPFIKQELNFAAIISILLITTGFLYLFINKSRIFKHPISKPFFVLISVAFFSTLFSADFSASLEELLRIVSIYTIFLIAYFSIKNKTDITQLTLAIVLSIIIPVSVAFYQLFSGTGNLDTVGFNRVMGTFVHPIMLAYYILLVSTIILVFALESKKQSFKLLSYVTFIPLSIIFVNTFARAAWLILLLVLLILAIAKYKQLFVAFTIIIIAVTLFFSSSITSRFEDLSKPKITEQGQDANSLESRQKIWQKNMPLVMANPVLGSGIGTSSRLVNEATHNDYLRLLTETGIFGLVAYLWLLLITIKSGWKAYKESSDDKISNLALVFFTFTVAYIILSFESNILKNVAFQWSFWALGAVVYENFDD